MIKISKTQESRLPSVDFDKIGFGRIFSDHMFVADYRDGEWKDMRIEPLHRLSVHPANATLHYGQSIFEGMKASSNNSGIPLLFRPDMHVKRLNASAERMCMPVFPEDLFVEALATLLDIDKGWIPSQEGSALYIRPFMFATDEFLGVSPSQTYKFIIMTSPVGPYYSRPVKLIASTEYVRAAHGGVGEAKTSGNYAASLLPMQLAKESGYDQVMWLDAKEFKFVQEVGTMNIFFAIGDRIITPATDGAILKGITRDCFLHILRDQGYIVEERKISIDEVIAAHKSGELKEVFGSGTAAVSVNVSHIKIADQLLAIPDKEWHLAKMLKKTISDIRCGKANDKWGWIIPVPEAIPA